MSDAPTPPHTAEKDVGRPCYRCGKDPAEGYASVWTAATGERWYCHGDDDESPTCYEGVNIVDPDAFGAAGYLLTPRVTSPAVCSGCGHGAHVPGLCEADERPACNCLTDSDTSPGVQA